MAINARVIAHGLAVMAIAVCGFFFYDVIFVLNVIIMTTALYVAGSIVAEVGAKQLLFVFTVSLFAIIVFNLSFSFVQQFIAFCISSFSLLVLIKYFLIRSHDSGWFGAFCVELLSFLFLFIIELVLVVIFALFL